MPDLPSKDAVMQVMPVHLADSLETVDRLQQHSGSKPPDYDLLWSLLQANQSATVATLRALFPE